MKDSISAMPLFVKKMLNSTKKDTSEKSIYK